MLALLALLGCGTDQQRLNTLKTDPLVTVPVPMASAERRTESKGNSGIGENSPSKIRRTFTVEVPEVQSTIDLLAAAAREAGWVLTPRTVIGFDGSRSIDGQRAQLVISAVAAEGTVWMEISARG